MSKVEKIIEKQLGEVKFSVSNDWIELQRMRTGDLADSLDVSFEAAELVQQGMAKISRKEVQDAEARYNSRIYGG